MAAGDLPTELARIAAMDTNALRFLWLKMTGRSPSRQLSGDLLRRMVMYRVQEQCLGGLDRKLAAMLDRLADGGGVRPTRLKLGSVLVREHDGALHQVMVVENGFAWNGRVLPSLSAVAKVITGTKWNGHRFFGLQRSSANRNEARECRSIRELARADAGETRSGGTNSVDTSSGEARP